MRVVQILVAGTMVLAAGSGSRVWAQSGRPQVAVTLGGNAGDGGAAPAVGVAGTLPVAPHAGLELEVSYAPQQQFTPRFTSEPQATPAATGGDVDGRTVAFLASFVAKLDQRGSLRPYARLGGGVANIGYTTTQLSGGVRPEGGSLPEATTKVSTTENALALAAGGGVEYRLRPQIGVGADLRYLRLFQKSEAIGKATNSVRFGVRLAVEF